jgi:hypothetical protein
VFRVSNDAVVLNDAADGDVFLIDTMLDVHAVKWTSSPVGRQTGRLAQQTLNDKTTLIAGNYTQGVRPGTTTVLHVLDVAKGPRSCRGHRARTAPPHLRPNYQQPPLSVASGGTIVIPVPIPSATA